MDPLSITASIIAVLQATNAVISLCYDFRAALQHTPWALTRTIEEARDLRNVLETLENLSKALQDDKSRNSKRMPSFQLLCEPEGPLDTCLRELTHLTSKIIPPSSVERPDSKRRALIRALDWKFKDADAKTSLERIERCKSTLSLAITADKATLLLDIQNTTDVLNKNVESMEKRFTNLIIRLQAEALDGREREIFQWLFALDPTENHETAMQAHQKGTNAWFIHSEEFTEWCQSDRSFLWLSGFPGAGKTILFSTAVTYLFQNWSDIFRNLPVRLAYFYCDFRKSEMQEPIYVISSLVAQLCSQTQRFPKVLETEFDHHSNSLGQKNKPSFSVLIEALEAFAKESKIILLIDALDESEKCQELLGYLSELQNIKGSINVLVTGRNALHIEEALSSFTRLRLESCETEMDHDILSYIDHRLQFDRKLKWLKPAVRSDIAQILSTKSLGMFRWVQCQIDSISALRTIKAVRKALEELPKGLNETYERILKNVEQSDIEIVRRTLLWLAFTVHHLNLGTLQEAVVIEHGLDHVDEESRLSSPDDILSLCGSLISVDDEGYARLAHMSVKDYLLSSEISASRTVSCFRMISSQANLELAIDCLTYLFFKEFRQGPVTTAEDYLYRTTTYPLAVHAARSWTYYARAADQSDELKRLTAQFFSPLSRNTFMSWVQILNAKQPQAWDRYPRHATSLYYAASFGLFDIVENLVKNGAKLNAPGSAPGGVALHATVIWSHLPIMKLLLETGADPNRGDYNGLVPLQTAVGWKNAEAAALLLEHKADPDVMDVYGDSPRDWALQDGNKEILALFPERKRGDGMTKEDLEETATALMSSSTRVKISAQG